ncbi:hypothetical protein DFJ58DRAFT_916266, partial [Suillus subalutaceus]|uniref:uncharacterized protein n=1 Tax=Suillus subalutaceus TaxID=48586 RepID=UPI001B86B743
MADNYNGSSRIKSTCWPLACFKARGQGPDPPPETCEATVRESSSQTRSRVLQAMRKFTKVITKKISRRFKCSRNRISAVQNENVDLQGASSNQNIENTSHPHPSTGDEHPTTAEIPSDSMNQGLSGEPASQVHAAPSDKEEGRDPKLVDAELQGACDSMQSMGLLGRRATSAASAAVNAPAVLAVADDYDTYLQPLKGIDTVIEKIANVHPYAKMALGVLSVASKIIIAQAERD